jgi:DNA-binding beta-propeller fold protein YncE
LWLLLLIPAALSTTYGITQSSLPHPSANSGIGFPIALAAFPSGNLIALESHGAIYLIDPGTKHARKLKDNIGYNTVVDLAGDRLDGVDTFFITSSWRAASSGSIGKVTQYSIAGQEAASWHLPGLGISVLALDSKNRRLLLADSQTANVYTLDIGAGKASVPTFLMEIHGPQAVSAIAYDAGHNQLFAADAIQGNLYVADLGQRKSALAIGKLREPRALALDAGSNKLYVADAGLRQIIVISTDTRSFQARVYSRAKEFREPAGVAVDAAHHVWVADSSAQAVYAISPSGDVVTTVRD